MVCVIAVVASAMWQRKTAWQEGQCCQEGDKKQHGTAHLLFCEKIKECDVQKE